MRVAVQLEPDGNLTLGEALDAVLLCEDAGVSAVVFEDRVAITEGRPTPLFETSTLASYLTLCTNRIGLVASDSALYGYAYHLARRLATLDHLSRGRSGWSMRTRTAPSEVASFEWRTTGRSEELERAGEFAEIALALWDSWEPGAASPNKATGDYKDDARIHPIEYESPSFFVRGPLDTPRSPQNRPLLFTTVQAAEDATFAGTYADVVTLASQTPEGLADLSDALRRSPAFRARAHTIALFALVAGTGEPARTGFPLPADPALAAARAEELVGDLGLTGVTVRGSGRPDWVKWLTDGFLPALNDLTTPIPGATLAASFELDRTLMTGRRVA